VGALISAGATSGQLRTAVQRGELIRIRKGWLGLPDARPEVIRAAEFGGRLTCLSAARYHGLWTPDEDRRIHVGVPQHAGRVHGNPAGLVVHWQSEPWTRRPSVVEPVAELIRQMLLCSVREDALAVIDSALNKGAITRAGLARIIRTLPPRFGSVLGEVDHRSESGLETLCRVRLSPLGVRVRSQVRIAGVGRVDLVVGDRIVIEADGEQWHEGRDAFTADRSRDLALVRLGYVVIRVGYVHVVHEWQRVELAVRGLIARNEHRWSAAHRRAGLAH
jgi:very-short-patch-repair endonuclease